MWFIQSALTAKICSEPYIYCFTTSKLLHSSPSSFKVRLLSRDIQVFTSGLEIFKVTQQTSTERWFSIFDGIPNVCANLTITCIHQHLRKNSMHRHNVLFHGKTSWSTRSHVLNHNQLLLKLSSRCMLSGGAPTPLTHRNVHDEENFHTNKGCEGKNLMRYGDEAFMT